MSYDRVEGRRRLYLASVLVASHGRSHPRWKWEFDSLHLATSAASGSFSGDFETHEEKQGRLDIRSVGAVQYSSMIVF